MLFTRDIDKLKDMKIIKVNNKRKDVSGKYKPKKKNSSKKRTCIIEKIYEHS